MLYVEIIVLRHALVGITRTFAKLDARCNGKQRVTIKKATTELAAAKSDEKEKEQQTRRRQKLLRRMASSDVQRETQF